MIEMVKIMILLAAVLTLIIGVIVENKAQGPTEEEFREVYRDLLASWRRQLDQLDIDIALGFISEELYWCKVEEMYDRMDNLRSDFLGIKKPSEAGRFQSWIFSIKESWA